MNVRRLTLWIWKALGVSQDLAHAAAAAVVQGTVTRAEIIALIDRIRRRNERLLRRQLYRAAIPPAAGRLNPSPREAEGCSEFHAISTTSNPEAPVATKIATTITVGFGAVEQAAFTYAQFFDSHALPKLLAPEHVAAWALTLDLLPAERIKELAIAAKADKHPSMAFRLLLYRELPKAKLMLVPARLAERLQPSIN